MNTPRKTFLKKTGAALAAAAATRLFAKGKEEVVIIGAGMAGLSAARKLTSSGFQVIVLEGRNRTGGRIWTDRSLGMPIDLGAAWIHGIQSNPVHALAKKIGAQMFRTDFESVSIFENAQTVRAGDLRRIEQAHESLLSKVMRKKRTASGRESMADAVNPLLANVPAGLLRRGVRWQIAADMEIEYAEDLANISLKYYDEDEAFDGDDVLFVNGYSALSDSLSAGLDVRLNHTVTKVDYTGDMARVFTNRGTFEADRVIVTLPLGVLKAGQVAFNPPLPAGKKQAIGRLGMGTMNKIAMVFPEAFWPNVHRLGGLKDDSERLVEFWNLRPLLGLPVLVCLSRGNFARSLDAGSTQAAMAFAMAELRAMFGSKVKEPVRAVHTGWSKDPFARGSYSSVAPGASIEDYDTLARSVEDTIFFAGEATNSKHPATVHGAFISGQRAAAEILADA